MATFENMKVSHGSEPSNQFAAITGGSSITNLVGNTPTGFTYTANGFADTLASDTVDLPSFALIRGLYIGGAGNITFEDWDGNVLGPLNVGVGVLPFRPRRIKATGLTASQIVLLR